MNRMKTLRLASALLVLALIQATAACAKNPSASDDVDPSARERMKASANYISKLESFTLEARLAYDHEDATGRLVEYGSDRRMSIRRPDRARVEADHRSGVRSIFTANGKTMTALRVRDPRYAQESQPGNLDEVVDAIIARIGMRPPLVDLLYSHLWDVLRPRIVREEYLGRAEIDGHDCDHLLFENEDFTWQIWIERGERPLPRRIVSRYMRRAGVPTLRAAITKWDVEPELVDSIFELAPQKGAKKVPFEDLAPRVAYPQPTSTAN